MVEARSLAPDSFINPSLPLYGMLPAVAVQHALAERGVLAGHAADPLLVARFLSGVMGALAVLVLGLLSRRLGLGLFPPLLLAVMPGTVNLCHFATPEAWLLAGASLTLALALAHVEGRASSWTLGLVLGLTASTKYTAAALIVPCVIAVWLQKPSPALVPPRGGPRSRHAEAALLGLTALVSFALAFLLLGSSGEALAKNLHLRDARLLLPEAARTFVRGLGVVAALVAAALAVLAALSAQRHHSSARTPPRDLFGLGLGALAGFLIGTPYALLRPLAFLSDLAYNQQTRHAYKGLVGETTSFLPYVSLLRDATTAPVLLAVLLGVVLAAARVSVRDRQAPVILAALLAPYLLVASSGHQALRFLAPGFPAAALLAGLGLAFIRNTHGRHAAQALVASRALLAALLVVRLFYVDSRLQASQWLLAHVPAGTTIDVITNHLGYAPAAPKGRTLRVVPTLSREMAPRERFLEAASLYPAEGNPWLILTASYYARFLEHPEQAPERAAFFQQLLDGQGGYFVAARFRQERAWRYPAEFLDPEIVVLRKR